jgi:NAD(P)-dependent dehydrogenase (short-subunit alcohol dehydrogenase family)
MSYDYSGKVVVVTGGSGALGNAVVDLYKEAGAQVVVTVRDAHEESEKHGNPAYFPVNVLEEDAVQRFFEETTRLYGALDAVVNVIGGYKAGKPVWEIELAEFEGQFELNLKTAFLITKHAVKVMLDKGGSIVHVSSRAAVESGKNAFSYSASKQGVLRLVEATAAELKEKNITINAVLPGIIDTPANREWAKSEEVIAKWPKPEQIAKVLLFLTSPDAELISGAAIPVYGKA